MNLKTFFNPKSIAVVGVSDSPDKLGSIIFQNILDAEYSGNLHAINPKHEGEELMGKPCLGGVADCAEPQDLVVIVIPGKFTPEIIDDCITNRTKNVIIISAGFSEIGNEELEDTVKQKCEENDINLLGPNCLGAIFPHQKLNASFSDGFPKPGNIAFISQSGAFCTAMLDWANEKNIGFSHFISLGNKAGISENEILESLDSDPNVKIIALYLESIKDGKTFLELIKRIAPNKPIIILEPGKSAKASEASSSHTGSLAPNYRVLQSAYKSVGAIQVESMREMFGLLEVLTFSYDKNFGKNLAILTNAGGVGVLTTDLTEEAHLCLADFESGTTKKLNNTLPPEANTHNPVDIIGDARSDRYQQALEILIQDKNVDQILVLLTPQRTTEVRKTAELIVKTVPTTNKNIVTSFIGGQRTQAGIQILKEHQVPHFDFPVDATRVMGALANRECERCHQTNEGEKVISHKTPQIKKYFKDAKGKNLKSLPQAQVDTILKHYGIDFPDSQNFTHYDEALSFATPYFTEKVVLKISSPDALHKTDLKGVILNINSSEKFKTAWEDLHNSIKKSGIKDAEIQVQEQGPRGTEIILGINSDPNFGKIMLFGTGGIYTEVFADTALRVLPCQDFEPMIKETKVSQILYGTRGEKPKAVKKCLKTMQKVQQLVLDFPEIISIDANPMIVTEERAICVDFKVLV